MCIRDRVYPYHLVVYRNGEVIIQPDEYEEGKSIFRLKCSGPMMNSHFEPLIPQYIPPPKSTVVDLPICTSLDTESPENIVVEQSAHDQSDDDIPLIHLLSPAQLDNQNRFVTPPDDLDSSSSVISSIVTSSVGKKRRKKTTLKGQ